MLLLLRPVVKSNLKRFGLYDDEYWFVSNQYVGGRLLNSICTLYTISHTAWQRHMHSMIHTSNCKKHLLKRGMSHPHRKAVICKFFTTQHTILVIWYGNAYRGLSGDSMEFKRTPITHPPIYICIRIYTTWVLANRSGWYWVTMTSGFMWPTGKPLHAWWASGHTVAHIRSKMVPHLLGWSERLGPAVVELRT